MKLRNSPEAKTFTSNIGIPQGDKLGSVVFTTYVENAFRKIRQPAQNASDSLELAHTDDAVFASCASFKDMNEIQKHLAESRSTSIPAKQNTQPFKKKKA